MLQLYLKYNTKYIYVYQIVFQIHVFKILHSTARNSRSHAPWMPVN